MDMCILWLLFFNGSSSSTGRQKSLIQAVFAFHSYLELKKKLRDLKNIVIFLMAFHQVTNRNFPPIQVIIHLCHCVPLNWIVFCNFSVEGWRSRVHTVFRIRYKTSWLPFRDPFHRAYGLGAMRPSLYLFRQELEGNEILSKVFERLLPLFCSISFIRKFCLCFLWWLWQRLLLSGLHHS